MELKSKLDSEINILNRAISDSPNNLDLYLERGRLHVRSNNFGSAMNDFNHVLRINPDHTEAIQYLNMVKEIIEFRYVDIYNP